MNKVRWAASVALISLVWSGSVSAIFGQSSSAQSSKANETEQTQRDADSAAKKKKKKKTGDPAVGFKSSNPAASASQAHGATKTGANNPSAAASTGNTTSARAPESQGTTGEADSPRATGRGGASSSGESGPAGPPSAPPGVGNSGNSTSARTPAGSSALPILTPANNGMVWVNTETGTYHKSGSRWYGKTKQGKYMTEADAQKAGYKASDKN
jgi:hypothetical protein